MIPKYSDLKIEWCMIIIQLIYYLLINYYIIQK